MVHAEASTFAEGLNKSDVYSQVCEQAKALFDNQRNWKKPILLLTMPRVGLDSNLANTASLLYHALHSLPSPSNATNWCGFYVVDPKNSNQLILGPFQGHVACQTIAIGKGVCGTAAGTKTTQLVKDVELFPGHIACDSNSKSEIVVPIIQGQKVVAIIDIDCAELSGFDQDDQAALEDLAHLLADACDF